MASSAANNGVEEEELQALPDERKAERELVKEDNLRDVLPHHEEEKEKLKGISKADIKRAVKEYVRKHGFAPSFKDPSKDSPYPEVPELPNAYHTFQLHHGGMSDTKGSRAIATVKAHHAKYKVNLLGYQCNQNLYFEKDFGSYLNILIVDARNDDDKNDEEDKDDLNEQLKNDINFHNKEYASKSPLSASLLEEEKENKTLSPMHRDEEVYIPKLRRNIDEEHIDIYKEYQNLLIYWETML